MKIEIDYNGALAVCRIEPMDEPGKMVNFNDADTKSQTYALSAFQTIKEQWQREQRLARFKNLPVMHVKRQIQVTMQNFNLLQELAKEGVITEWSFDTSRTSTLSVKLSDDHTIVEDNGWLIQDTEGRWWGMDNGSHRMLEEYKKIIIEPQADNETLAKRIEDCNVSVRTMNICKANGIDTLGDLTKLHKTDWLKFRNGGKMSLIELDDLLHDNGLDWAEWR